MKKLIAFTISAGIAVSAGVYAIAKIPGLYDQIINWALSSVGII